MKKRHQFKSTKQCRKYTISYGRLHLSPFRWHNAKDQKGISNAMQLTQYRPLHNKSVLESVLRSDPEIPPCQCHKVMLLIVVIVVSPNLYNCLLPSMVKTQLYQLSLCLTWYKSRIKNKIKSNQSILRPFWIANTYITYK